MIYILSLVCVDKFEMSGEHDDVSTSPVGSQLSPGMLESLTASGSKWAVVEWSGGGGGGLGDQTGPSTWQRS